MTTERDAPEQTMPMSDERLAEIEREHAEIQFCLDKGEMIPLYAEIQQEQRAELLAEVKRLRAVPLPSESAALVEELRDHANRESGMLRIRLYRAATMIAPND